MATSTTLILGAGFGGIATANALRRQLPPEHPGTIAEGQGQAVASQIAAAVLGRPAEAFGGAGTCYIETGGQHAVRGEGQFYALPHPVMRATPPDRAQYEGKLAWISEWLRANLSP